MHPDILRKTFLPLTFWLALFLAPVKAQMLPILDTSSTGTFGVDTNGLLYSTGSLNTGTLSLTGGGIRMFWYPAKAAFRAGGVSGSNSTAWDPTNIGLYSTAFGLGTTASGWSSLAAGLATKASGGFSAAFGASTTASGGNAVAFGASTTASGSNAAAFGFATTASNYSSVAFGNSSVASGAFSFSSGEMSTASGNGSFAVGGAPTASGDFSVALNGDTAALGDYTTASGYYTTAASLYETAVGVSNAGTNSGGGAANPTAWVPTDPLFEIGNGATSDGYGNPAATGASDAFVVYKNGTAAFQGVVTAAPGGDIPMYSGN